MNVKWLVLASLFLLVLVISTACGTSKDILQTSTESLSDSSYEGGELLQGLPPYAMPTSLSFDKDNVLWIGMQYNNGIVAYSNTHFTIYDRLNTPIPDSYITTVFTDSDNTKWEVQRHFLFPVSFRADGSIYNRLRLSFYHDSGQTVQFYPRLYYYVEE